MLQTPFLCSLAGSQPRQVCCRLAAPGLFWFSQVGVLKPQILIQLGDNRLSRVPESPLRTHAPLIGPRWCPVGLPVLRCATRLIRSDNTSRTAVFQFAQTVGFGPDASCPGYPYGPRLYKFRGAITRPAFSLAQLHTQ